VRVSYIVGWPGGPSTGPFKKIDAQTRIWADEGVAVGLYVLTTAEHRAAWAALPYAREVIARSRGPRLALQKERLLGAALAWQPDLVYHRWSLPYPGLIRAVRTMPFVFEVNSDDVAEYDLTMPAKARINRATRGLILRRAAGLTFVTQELRTATAFAPYRNRSVIIANGINLDDVPSAPAPVHDRPRLLLIGQPDCPWHGIDKVVWLAKQEPGWDFDVVGPRPDEAPGAPGNLTVHGLLSASEYQPLLAQADVGLGSLALHRKAMNEASPLKVREYLASGLPAIIAYVDTDFPNGSDHLLALPNVERNVCDGVQQIEQFVQRWRGRRVPRSELAHLDHRTKERARLEFFRSLLS
jgi:glycosyltransferase involved in cell wall biosynthesis